LPIVYAFQPVASRANYCFKCAYILSGIAPENALLFQSISEMMQNRYNPITGVFRKIIRSDREDGASRRISIGLRRITKVGHFSLLFWLAGTLHKDYYQT
jgi:hypothetical protein